MSTDKLDDESLVAVAKRAWVMDTSGDPDRKVPELINRFAAGKYALTNVDRNLLIGYIRQRQEAGRQLPMTAMKAQILKAVGFTGDLHHTFYPNGNFSREQMAAVYEFLVKKTP